MDVNFYDVIVNFFLYPIVYYSFACSLRLLLIRRRNPLLHRFFIRFFPFPGDTDLFYFFFFSFFFIIFNLDKYLFLIFSIIRNSS